MPLAPPFSPDVLAARRALVLRRMAEIAPGSSVAVFPSPPVSVRNHDVDHPYRAESDLFWLTGFEEPEAVAVLSTGDKPFTLFVRPRDREKEIWTGRRSGVEGAKTAFGADVAFTVDALEKELAEAIAGKGTLFYRIGGVDPGFDARIARILQGLRMRGRAGSSAPTRIEDPGQIVHEMR